MLQNSKLSKLDSEYTLTKTKKRGCLEYNFFYYILDGNSLGKIEKSYTTEKYQV